MIYKRYRLFGSALCMSLALLATSCSMSDDMECPPDPAGGGTGKAYIQLSFRMADAQGTRANPNGGENGDGDEAGQYYENKIEDAVAFLFNGNETANGSATTLVTPVYFSTVTRNPDDTHYVTETKQADVETGEYNLIVVANPGDRWWETISPLNLHEVRDHIQKTAWKTNADGTYIYFLMSSAAEPTQTLKLENSSEEEPATTIVDVERMAARVDYRAEGEFDITGDANYEDASVTILGATIINNFNAGSYILKRVSKDPTKKTGSDVTYLGIEETGADGLPTNYVIDPWTAEKNSTNADLNNTPFTTVDGKPVNAARLYVDGSYLYSGSKDPEWWSTRMIAGTPITDPEDNKKWQRVGYTLENTTAQGQTAKTYNTGLAFQAQFNPGSALADYKTGHTFFRYSDRLYTSLTAMMGQLNEQTDFADYFNDAVDNLKSRTWADVTAFCDALSYDPVGLASYFTSLQGDAQGTDAVGTALDDVTWTAFLATLGVDERDLTDPQINKGGVTDTRARLYASSNGLLRTYYKGLCYYIWWLRHSNDDSDETNGLMEYAVVRNNIYKVEVSSVASIGGDVPDDTEIMAHVYVKDWVLLDGETLPM